MATNLQILPTTKYKMSVLIDHVFKEVVDESLSMDGFTITKTTGAGGAEAVTVPVDCTVKTYDNFVSLRDKINDTGFFIVWEALSVSRNDGGQAEATTTTYTVSMTLSVTDKGFEQAGLTEKEQQALQEKLENGGKKKTETSGSDKETSQTSQASQASQASKTSA